MDFQPKGIIPAMVTPFHENGELDKKAVVRITNYLIENGAHGLFPTGSQGEFWALEPEEKATIWEIVVNTSGGRVPVFAGAGDVTTRKTIKLVQLAQEVNVDALSVITPFFINPSPEELYEHYAEIAESTSLPILLYSNPGRTGVQLPVNLVVKLSRLKNIVGIKDSSGDMTLTAEYIRNTGHDFSILAGRDTMIYATLAYGGNGSITATANAAPSLAVSIYENYINHQHEEALRAQLQLAPLRRAFSLGTFPVVVKEALNMCGINVGYPRRPVGRMKEEDRQELREVLAEMGLVAG